MGHEMTDAEPSLLRSFTVMAAYSSNRNIHPDGVTYRHRGVLLEPQHTISDLQWEDGDVIHVEQASVLSENLVCWPSFRLIIMIPQEFSRELVIFP